ncbi:MAG: hypothetical protein HONBIEJF_02301 [Fimbriimonadaceae bacterium]|nr:hypothetical protein [Fimbriimonadaceae bacterium]
MTEESTRLAVLRTILQYVAQDRTIRLSDHLGGELKGFRYSFEGEDDLLHLSIARADGSALTVEEAQTVVAELLPGMPAALIWLKPGQLSHHFYMGHDDLVASIRL